MTFVDAHSDAPVGNVLLIPQYSASTGLSTGAGHGPGRMSEALLVSFPTVYRSGEPFRLRQPDSKGISLSGTLFVGRGISVKGVTVLAPGYEGTWVWKLWERPTDFRVPLEPLVDNVEATRDRLLNLLDQPRIRGWELRSSERDIFSVIPDFDIEIQFTKDDRQLIHEFMAPSPKL